MRLPIRLRLTAWYAVLVAAIIVALGAFIVLRLRADLQARVDREVQESSFQIANGYALEGAEDFRDVSRTVLPRGDSAAQVLDPSGRVLMACATTCSSRRSPSSNAGEPVAREPIAPPPARADALAGKRRVLTVKFGPDEQRFRAMVSPVRRLGEQRLLVVAESLREVDESVHRVLILLLLAGPAALAATALGGWWLARKALLPVERMTSKAEQIGIDRLHERIALPRTADEIGRLAVTLNAMLDRLERGVAEKHRLIADASHELRTPLAAMRAELDVSLRGDELPPEARAVLESTREEVDWMSRTVDNLLTLARVDEGRLELLMTRIDLGEAIENAAAPLRPLAATKRLRLEVDGEPWEARADAQRVHQALTNLIENAIKFSQPGGEVRISSWHRGDEVGVTVTDEGPGIPAEARAHVFDRFYRADRARGRDGGGSGLGLAICREIAIAHGGRVWVDSEEGKGSAFSLAFPGTPHSGRYPRAPQVARTAPDATGQYTE
jgi:heavy metal sensor kinase